ncbi:mesoderm posterior aa [Pangasianodon hypophthalmus]|uniref:mesoderm posterior aa n=1 Tax=Pangasianodon hypophthalmus TaxID=310915 RepID=UPI002307462C|nr:mesoderm posterior aa [Pangasianodon hypophthalmus]
MDVSSSLFQLQDNTEFLFDCEGLLEQSFSASDAGYYSACSSLSPASSTDSNCFSPPTFHYGTGQESFPETFHPKNSSDQEEKKNGKVAKRTGRPRSKFPGLKRQSASEREKLRMRDLTKALHHLRTYLPPSVAPSGQTLTKIETLRLTIRYISYLSAQLELGQEEAAQGSPSAPMQAPNTPAFYEQSFNQVAPQTSSFSTQGVFNMPYCQNAENSSLPPSPAQDYWIPQQQYCYYGQC